MYWNNKIHDLLKYKESAHGHVNNKIKRNFGQQRSITCYYILQIYSNFSFKFQEKYTVYGLYFYTLYFGVLSSRYNKREQE